MADVVGRNRDQDLVEKNIREIFELYARDKITEEEAEELLDRARRTRHGFIGRFLANTASG